VTTDKPAEQSQIFLPEHPTSAAMINNIESASATKIGCKEYPNSLFPTITKTNIKEHPIDKPLSQRRISLLEIGLSQKLSSKGTYP
jgi:hypothetical protein